jgi:alkylation response protein AidB-like acyl-CoA dehydrogenase
VGEFAFTDEQRELKKAVRQFCARNFDEQSVRRLMESELRHDPQVWGRLGNELGVLGLSVSESAGGSGGSLVDLAVAVEELGGALSCGPLFGTMFLSIPALAAASPGRERDQLLADLVAGNRTAALAVPDAAGSFDADLVTMTSDGDTVSGTVNRVVDAAAVDVLLVAAGQHGGIRLFAVDAQAPGVRRTELDTIDLTRPQADIEFDSAPATLIAGPDEASRVLTQAILVGAALLAVEQVGAGQHLLDLAVAYAKTRMQFGRQIGSFQAVKHRLADMLVDLEHARSTAYHAVWAIADGSDDATLAASMAQATCSAALSRIAADTIQVHGGIGFTWEHEAHLYFKRAITDAALLGTSEQHRDRVAQLVLDTAVPGDNPVAVANGLGRR